MTKTNTYAVGWR